MGHIEFSLLTRLWKNSTIHLHWEETEKSEGNSIFCCVGSRENYFGSVGQQDNNNNPTFLDRHM